MWTELPLPPIPEPITAVSLPTDSKLLYVWSKSAVYRMKLVGTMRWHHLCHSEKAITCFRDDGRWQYGVTGCLWIGRCGDREFLADDTNLFTTHRHGDRVEIDGSTVRLVNPAKETVVEVNDFHPRQTFAIAGFHKGITGFRQSYSVSDDFTIAMTNSVRVFRYKGRGKPSKGAWQSSGVLETYDDLIRTIVADPDNDGLRLIYADWLEESGDAERAQFIRLQIRIAERERSDVVMPNDADRLLEEQLATRRGRQWKSQFPKLRGVSFGQHPLITDFWRGFPKLDVSHSTPFNLSKLLLHHPADAATVFFENWMSDRPLQESHRLLAERLRSIRIHHFHGRIILPQRAANAPVHFRLDLFPLLRFLACDDSCFTHDQLNRSLLSTTHDHLEQMHVKINNSTQSHGPILPALHDVKRFPRLKTIVFVLEYHSEPGDGLSEIASLYPNVYFWISRERKEHDPYQRVTP